MYYNHIKFQLSIFWIIYYTKSLHGRKKNIYDKCVVKEFCMDCSAIN